VLILSQGLLQLPTLCWLGRCTRRWEGAQPGQLTQTGQRDIPYCMMSWSAYKLGRKLARCCDCCLESGWASPSEGWTIALCITYFVYSTTIIIIIISSFTVLFNYLYLTPWTLLGFFPRFSSPSHQQGGVSKQLHGA